MGALFRSEDMVLVRLYFERVAAHDTVEELGALGLMQFKDLNPEQSAFQRTFSNDIKRAEDMQRRLRFLDTQVASMGSFGESDEKVYHFDPVGPDAGSAALASIRIDDLDKHLTGLERSLTEMNAHWASLNAQCNELTELRYVLEKAAEFFSEEGPRFTQASYGTLGMFDPITSPRSFGRRPSVSGEQLLTDTTAMPSKTPGLLSFHAGVIEKEKVPAFERVLFRATRGNCFPRFADVPEPLTDPATGVEMQKSVFVIFFSGNEVRAKVGKICTAFGANRYPFPDEHEEQMRAYAECRGRIKDLGRILETTNEQRRDTLAAVAGRLPVWKEKVKREKAIFHTMNLLNFDTSNKLFIGEGWCPANAIGDIRLSLDTGRRRSNAQVPSVLEERHHGHETPPTYYKTNRFTEVFQGIVESYGVAQYHEVNPAVYTVVTFPFLFAVMFGDVGHGIIMALFALWLILSEKKLKGKKLNEFLETCYQGRYIIVLMGLFSIYTGFIYNEAFAVPLNLFGSRWKYTDASTMACGVDNCEVPSAVMPPLKPYPFGFDPVWKGSQTGLLFFNSYKMKLSIVLGVAQMVMGICLSYVNAKFFKEPIDIYYVFIPQMIFMNAIFGYLVFLIILKWCINWNSAACVSDPNCEPPDLKAILIGMFMSPGHVPEKMRMFPLQGPIQFILLVSAIVAIPWMLVPKPLLLKARHDKKRGYRPLDADHDTEAGSVSAVPEQAAAVDDDDVDHGGHGRFDFTDTLVNQMIHTIEFVLGAVSNTASYLRLWALSLAHAELSDVFLEKLLLGTLRTGNPIAIAIGFSLWLVATLGVLMGMESLSAFLHALRLHWVEFQNKFYNLHGSGTKFIPFSFAGKEEDEG